MSEQGRHVSAAIGRATRRVRAQQFAFALAGLLPAAVVIALIEIVVRQFVPSVDAFLLYLNLGLAAAAVSALVMATLRGTRTRDMALAVDRGANLSDRVTSAAEFLSMKERSAFHDAQIRDAERAAAGVAVAPLFPFAWKESGKRLLAALLVLPFVYAAWTTDLTGLFAGSEDDAAPEEERFAEPEIDQEIAELEEAGIEGEILQLIRPAEELIRQWKERLRQIEQAKRDAQPELPEPADQQGEYTVPQTVLQAATRDLPEPAARSVQPEMSDQRVTLSDLKSLVDKEADGDYAEAFEYLDKKAFGDGPKMLNVEEFAKQMQDQGKQQMRAGHSIQQQAQFAGENNPGAENNKMGAMMNQLQGAQQQSFADFLSEYAAHLSRLLNKMQGIIEQKGKEDEHPDVKEKFKLAGEVPADAKRIELTEITEKDLKEGKIRRLAPDESGDSRAGVGFGTPEGAYKVKKVERRSTEYADLDSQFGEGQTMQILQDLEQGDASQYANLFQQYAIGAEDLLNQEDIPAAIKNFVREYFLAISPANLQKQ